MESLGFSLLPHSLTNVISPYRATTSQPRFPPRRIRGTTRALPYRAFRRAARRHTLDRRHHHRPAGGDSVQRQEETRLAGRSAPPLSPSHRTAIETGARTRRPSPPCLPGSLPGSPHRCSPLQGITAPLPLRPRWTRRSGRAASERRARRRPGRTRCRRRSGAGAPKAATAMPRPRASCASKYRPVPDAAARLRRIAAILLDHATRACSQAGDGERPEVR